MKIYSFLFDDKKYVLSFLFFPPLLFFVFFFLISVNKKKMSSPSNRKGVFIPLHFMEFLDNPWILQTSVRSFCSHQACRTRTSQSGHFLIKPEEAPQFINKALFGQVEPELKRHSKCRFLTSITGVSSRESSFCISLGAIAALLEETCAYGRRRILLFHGGMFSEMCCVPACVRGQIVLYVWARCVLRYDTFSNILNAINAKAAYSPRFDIIRGHYQKIVSTLDHTCENEHLGGSVDNQVDADEDESRGSPPPEDEVDSDCDEDGDDHDEDHDDDKCGCGDCDGSGNVQLSSNDNSDSAPFVKVKTDIVREYLAAMQMNPEEALRRVEEKMDEIDISAHAQLEIQKEFFKKVISTRRCCSQPSAERALCSCGKHGVCRKCVMNKWIRKEYFECTFCGRKCNHRLPRFGIEKTD